MYAGNYSTAKKKELSAKQYKLIELLVSGHSIVASAKIAGVCERTAHNWLAQPAFQQAYRKAKQSIFDEKLEEIKDGIHIALEALKRNMTEDTRGYVQVQAASKWLDVAIELYKAQELEERIKELEEAIKG